MRISDNRLRGSGSRAMNPIAVITKTVGVVLGLAGFEHGLFELLQGNVPTPGRVVQAIGPGQRFWPLGTEEAFTLAPTFLVAGISSMLIAIGIVVWSLFFLRTRYGSSVFLLLSVLLFLAGGGIGQIVLFLPAWAFSTRIDKPLRGLRRVLAAGSLPILSRLWIPALVLSTAAVLLGIEAAVFGWIPGVREPAAVQAAAMLLVLSSAILNVVAYLSACAHRILHTGPASLLSPVSSPAYRSPAAGEGR